MTYVNYYQHDISKQGADATKIFQEIEKRKEEIRNELPQEPDSDDPDVIRVLIKLPNGMRLDRRFIRHQSLKVCKNLYLV